MLPRRKVAPATVPAVSALVPLPSPQPTVPPVTRPTLRPDLRALDLGATLYVPATRQDLVPLANGDRLPRLRSLIFCTEDAVAADRVDDALARLADMLARLTPGGPHRFVRVRHPDLLARMLAMDDIDRIDGFVLPKITVASLADYMAALGGDRRFWLMPTLETAEAFDPAEARALRIALAAPEVHPRILALRIGANDLMNLLGIRRSLDRTIYETAIGPTIAMLAGLFRPHGFALTGPVFEGLEHTEVLAREVRQDLDHGLFGKTAVHPSQVPVIEAGYRVTPVELEMAEEILNPVAEPVFSLHGAMCEPATHRAWAEAIQARHKVFGVTWAATDWAGG